MTELEGDRRLAVEHARTSVGTAELPLNVPFEVEVMQSTFISYGRPDERFARKLSEHLRQRAG